MTKQQDQVRSFAGQLKDATQRLQEQQDSCAHTWGEIAYDPEYQAAYHIPADGQGSDFRSSCDVPAKTTPKWKKTCSTCGLTLITRETKKVSSAGTVAGCSQTASVPDFDRATKERV